MAVCFFHASTMLGQSPTQEQLLKISQATYKTSEIAALRYTRSKD
jgi:hypothetical protein